MALAICNLLDNTCVLMLSIFLYKISYYLQKLVPFAHCCMSRNFLIMTKIVTTSIVSSYESELEFGPPFIHSPWKIKFSFYFDLSLIIICFLIFLFSVLLFLLFHLIFMWIKQLLLSHKLEKIRKLTVEHQMVITFLIVRMG